MVDGNETFYQKKVEDKRNTFVLSLVTQNYIFHPRSFILTNWNILLLFSLQIFFYMNFKWHNMENILFAVNFLTLVQNLH